MTKSNVERSIETLVDFADAHRTQMRDIGEHFDRAMERIAEAIASLSTRMAEFREEIAELKDFNQQILRTIERQTLAIDGHLRVAEQQGRVAEQQGRIAEQQAANIAELTRMVVSQQSTINRLLERLTA
jgi:methyl-accepting chemotaxis protein